VLYKKKPVKGSVQQTYSILDEELVVVQRKLTL